MAVRRRILEVPDESYRPDMIGTGFWTQVCHELASWNTRSKLVPGSVRFQRLVFTALIIASKRERLSIEGVGVRVGVACKRIANETTLSAA